MPFVLGGLALVVVLGGIAAWYVLWRSDPEPSRPLAETRAWATALADQRFGDLDVLASQPGASQAAADFFTTAEVDGIEVTVVPPVLQTSTTAISRLGIELDVQDMGPWNYVVTLPWTLTEADEWKLDYTPAVLHPELTDARTIRRVRSTGERASLLDRDGQPLRAGSEVIEVAIQPSRMTDQSVVEAALESQLGIPPAETQAALSQPWVTADSRVPIAVLPVQEYEDVHRDVLYPVPGLVFADRSEPQLPSSTFASQTVGDIAEITAEQLDELGDRYEAGDIVGRNGLEAEYEATLAGGVDHTIELLEGDTVLGTLLSSEGADPQPVTTTFSVPVQLAADAALAEAPQPAALVAVDPDTGEILAVSSSPTDGFNRALSGQYPPGSTFKVVTSAGLLDSGVTTDQIVSCPPEIEINGNTISNFEGQSLGDVPFSEVFVNSCNTGFIALSQELGAEALDAAASDAGFDVAYDIGTASVGGVFPLPTGRVELGAASIGQAQVLASPLHMATVAAAAESGTWNAPLLIRDETVEPIAVPDAIPPEVRELMLEVVGRGTGTAAAVDGLTVGGKTGTAEFGTGDELATHAWFIGFAEGEGLPGKVAFAVVIEGGGTGGGDAAPVARSFLENLAASGS
jgi:cell division protein FtsI/penicillin-binding protein 2